MDRSKLKIKIAGDQIHKKNGRIKFQQNFSDSREPKMQLSFEFMSYNSAKRCNWTNKTV